MIHDEVRLLRGQADGPKYLGNLLADVGAGAAARKYANGLKEGEMEKWEARSA